MKKAFLLAFLLLSLSLTEIQAQSVSTNNFYRRFYRITVVSNNEAMDQELGQYDGNVHTDPSHGGRNQQWAVMPLFITAVNGSITSRPTIDYLIASLQNGKVLTIYSSNNVACYPYAGYDHQSFKLNNRAPQVFEISSPKNPSYTLDKSHSSKNRNPFSSPSSHTDNIYFGARHGGTNQQFRFDVSTPFANPITSIRSKRNTQIPFPRYPTSYTDQLPTETAKTFVSETFIPFPLVKNDLAINAQVETTPYYRLVRSQYYKLPEDTDADITYRPGESVNRTLTVKNGMKSTSVTEVTRKLNVAFTASNEIGIAVPGDVLSIKMSQALSASFDQTVRTLNSYEETYETTESYTYNFQVQQSVRLVTYSLVDHYELFRADGTLVLDWDVRTRKVTHVSYPSEVELNSLPSGGRVNTYTKNSSIRVTLKKSGSRTNSVTKESISAPVEDDTFSPLALKVYPNPTDGTFTIAYNRESDTELSVVIYTASGLEVRKDVVGRFGEKMIDISDLSPGLYLIKATIGSETATKFIYKN